MALIAKRVIAVLAVLMGCASAVGGLWLSIQIGPSGSATFSATPPARAGIVVLTPQILNRLAGDYVVSARPAHPGQQIFLGVASPSDANLIVGTQPATVMTGVSVRDQWAIRSTQAGSGEPHAVEAADIWRSTVTGAGTQTLTVHQDNAPESMVITATDGQVGRVSVTVENKAWFVQALVAAVVGLALVLGGILLWRSRFGSHPRAKHDARMDATEEAR